MKSRTRLTFAVTLLCLLVVCSPASAHYLWVVLDAEKGGQAVANIYFEESPRPGDGHYLNHFLGSSKVWIRTLEKPKPRLVTAAEVKEGENRWMRSELPPSDNISVDAYGKFGVYAYGKTNVLLHYYAKTLSVGSHDAIHELGRAEQMDLDLVPHDMGEKLELKLLWKGKPAPQRNVFVRGPQGLRETLKTDKRGRILLEPKAPGQYLFRSSVEEPIAGEDNGKSFDLIRHNITMRLKLPLLK